MNACLSALAYRERDWPSAAAAPRHVDLSHDIRKAVIIWLFAPCTRDDPMACLRENAVDLIARHAHRSLRPAT
jgi:hypothetical protein